LTLVFLFTIIFRLCCGTIKIENIRFEIQAETCVYSCRMPVAFVRF